MALQRGYPQQTQTTEARFRSELWRTFLKEDGGFSVDSVDVVSAMDEGWTLGSVLLEPRLYSYIQGVRGGA